MENSETVYNGDSTFASGVVAMVQMQAPNVLPDARGRFGEFGGRYVPETTIPALDELGAEYAQAQRDPAFQAELNYHLRDFVGRATPLYHAERLSAEYGARIYL